MIGRDAEIVSLTRMIDDARAGRGGALVIHGEAGVGKSALLGRAAEVAGDDVLLLRASGIEAESELPFAGLHLLLRRARRYLDRLPATQWAALRQAFGEDGPRPVAEAPPDRFLVGLAVLTLLAELAEERPVLCLVDDVQWMDRASADALLFAARRLADERIGMLFAARGGPEAAPGIPELRIGALVRTDSERLLAARHGDLGVAARDRVVEEAEGNPLALLRLAAGLTGPQRAGHLAPLPLRPAGPSSAGRLEQSLRDAVRRLPERTRLLLVVAAADGTGDLRLVLRASRELGCLPADLAPAESADLVEASGEDLRFRHPLIRSAAYDEATVAQRVAAHRSLAALLDGPDSADHTDRADRADRRIWHLSAAALGPDEDLASALADAGERARARGGNSAAATAYERAAQLTPGQERRALWLTAAARAALGAGQLTRASGIAARGAELTSDPALLAGLAHVRAEVGAVQGDPASAAQTLISTAIAVSRTAPSDAASLLSVAASGAWFAGDREALRRASRHLDELGPDIHPDLVTVATAVRGMERVAVGDPAGGLPLLRGALPADRTRVTSSAAAAYGVFAGLMSGDDDAACELAAAWVASCRRRGMVGTLPHALQLLAQALTLADRYAEAAETGAESWRIAQDTGQAPTMRHLRGILARLAALRGEDDECARLAREAEGADRERHGSGWGGSALTLLDLARSRYPEARVRAEEILRGPLGHTVIVTFGVPDLIEACCRTGDAARAAEVLARFDTWADASGQAWAAAVSLRCHALLAHDPEPLFERSLATHPEGARPFERARTELLYGEWLRRARRRADARTHLHAALTAFTDLGAEAWSQRARTELTAAGVRLSTPGPPTALSTLTHQELQVVRLAATGATNRQIAAELFLSPRTVGSHLYRAFPKLGIASRAELQDLDLGR